MYSSNWIHKLESELHFRFYWHQLKIMENRINKSDHIIEIGIGTGFISNYLRSKGYMVTTVDIDAEKNPDQVRDIRTYVPDADVIIAFNILEHIHYDSAIEILNKMRCKKLFIGLPRAIKQIFGLSLKLGHYEKEIILWWPRKIFTPAHYWELPYNYSNFLKDCPFILKDKDEFKRQVYFYMVR